MDVPETPFLTRVQLAARWHMSVKTLETWAASGTGPEPRRFGRRSLYRLSDVERFEARVWGAA